MKCSHARLQVTFGNSYLGYMNDTRMGPTDISRGIKACLCVTISNIVIYVNDSISFRILVNKYKISIY